MKNILQKELKAMEERNPSRNSHPQNLVRALKSKIQIFTNRTRGIEQVPQQEHIYDTDPKKSRAISAELYGRADIQELLRGIAYKIRPGLAYPKIGSPAEISKRLTSFGDNLPQIVEINRESLEKKCPYQVYAEANMQAA